MWSSERNCFLQCIPESVRLSSGELAAYNNLKINEINAMLETVATRTELHDVAQTIIGQHQSDIKGAQFMALDCNTSKCQYTSSFHSEMDYRHAVDALSSQISSCLKEFCPTNLPLFDSMLKHCKFHALTSAVHS